ncbi:MAG: hypothetical protein ACOX4D_05385 [Bacteroidales bacterium]|jgi:hypothetical protein
MKKLLILCCIPIIMFGCKNNSQEPTKNEPIISSSFINTVIDEIAKTDDKIDKPLLERGVTQVSKFWTDEDGTKEDFKQFCIDNFMTTPEKKLELFNRIQYNLEVLFGSYNKISVELKLPLHVDEDEVLPIDYEFGALNPYAHFNDDMFNSKIAHITMLNFPFFTLQEKNELGKNWDRTQWAYARMGDVFTSRVPAEVSSKTAKASTEADTYISNYNIYMGNLLNDNSEQLFPNDMVLISHWGLRDQLKSDYADKENGLEKQEMIYSVMKHIVNQTIPSEVINSDEYFWNPKTNEIIKDGKEVEPNFEPNTRYQFLYNICQAEFEKDKYCPNYPTYIKRSFEQDMEVTYDEIETMFVDFISSPVISDVANLIKENLGRELRPYDIWYNGFRAGGDISEDKLSEMTKKKYPNKDAVQNDLPNILVKLGFDKANAERICSKVTVDPSRGAGHAWGAQMKSDNARLRTRIGKDGMDYKGYNIAVHEFGHNVEQTITLHDVDNYIMNGVPNTAFTEALAFVFQMRDIELLMGNNSNSDIEDREKMLALDIFWGCYEIMGVSLVEMRTWKWIYDNPTEVTPESLKNTILTNAKDVWNTYYEPILGEKDSPILAIYSHSIDVPLYLPNYPYGHIIEFQIEEQLKGKNIADEIMRMYPVGRLTPNIWMNNAVGVDVSPEPLIELVKSYFN